MNLRTAGSIALIIFAIGLCFWLFVKPLLVKPEIDVIDEADLMYIGDDKDGEAGYLNMKAEIKDWVSTIAQISPILIAVMAYFMKKRKA